MKLLFPQMVMSAERATRPVLACSFDTLAVNPRTAFYELVGSGATAQLRRLPNAIGALNANTRATVWSKDADRKLFAAGDNANKFFYVREGVQMRRITSAPTDLALSGSGATHQAAWSPDNQIFVMPGSGSFPDQFVVARYLGGEPTGAAFDRVDDAGGNAAVIQFDRDAWSAAFSRHSQYLVGCYQFSSGLAVRFYRTTDQGVTWTFPTQSVTQPSANSRTASWMTNTAPGGHTCIVGANASPWLHGYFVANSSPTTVANKSLTVASGAPTDEVRSVRFSPGAVEDNNPGGTTGYVAVAFQASPYLRVYALSGYSPLTLTPATLSANPAGAAQSLAWIGNGQYLAVGHDTSPYVTLYFLSGGTFTKCPDPDDLPGGRIYDMSWSDNPWQ